MLDIGDKRAFFDMHAEMGTNLFLLNVFYAQLTTSNRSLSSTSDPLNEQSFHAETRAPTYSTI